MSFKRMFEKKEIEKIVEEHSGGSELYKHKIKWHDIISNKDLYSVVVDNNPNAYTQSTLLEKYELPTFTAVNQMSGPPGDIAIIGPSFKADDTTIFYGFVTSYDFPIAITNLDQMDFVDDTVTTF